MLLLEKIYLVLYEFSVLILKFTFANILWIIVNLPVAVVIIQIVLTTESTNLWLLLPIFTFLLPLLFFPGTNALISTTRDYVLEEKSFKLLSFFSYYKDGYKNSFLVGMVYTSLITLLGYLYYLTYESYLILVIILFVLFFYLSISVFYLLYLDVHYDMPLNWKVRQTFVFIVKHPLFAFANFIIFITLHYIMYSVSFILFVLFGTSLIVYATYYLFIRKLKKINTATSTSQEGDPYVSE